MPNMLAPQRHDTFKRNASHLKVLHPKKQMFHKTNPTPIHHNDCTYKLGKTETKTNLAPITEPPQHCVTKNKLKSPQVQMNNENYDPANPNNTALSPTQPQTHCSQVNPYTIFTTHKHPPNHEIERKTYRKDAKHKQPTKAIKQRILTNKHNCSDKTLKRKILNHAQLVSTHHIQSITSATVNQSTAAHTHSTQTNEQFITVSKLIHNEQNNHYDHTIRNKLKHPPTAQPLDSTHITVLTQKHTHYKLYQANRKPIITPTTSGVKQRYQNRKQHNQQSSQPKRTNTTSFPQITKHTCLPYQQTHTCLTTYEQNSNQPKTTKLQVYQRQFKLNNSCNQINHIKTHIPGTSKESLTLYTPNISPKALNQQAIRKLEPNYNVPIT
eukprot:gene3391-2345_t